MAGARKAASLIVLRDRADDGGLEVLMLRRAERDGDLRSGAAVFPGGVLDARDRDAHGRCRGWTDAQASQRLSLPVGGLDYLVAAARESFEEVGLLFLRPRGAVGDEDAPAWAAGQATAQHAWREALQRGECSWVDLCTALDAETDLGGWHYWSHWLTPPGNPKRFDTRFFVTRAPQGQTAQADGGEALELMWLTPQQALDPERRLKLLPVTRRTLQQLAAHDRVDSVLALAARTREVPLTMPRLATGSRGPRVVLPDEMAWAEVGRLDPRGRGDVWAEIVAGRPVHLSPRVIRVTAPNPGVMTGPGTNSYLVGDPAVNRWTVIDPGPEDAQHLQALLAAAPGPIERILVTHTHRDHSPGAAALAQATGAPRLGRVADHPQGQDTAFRPDTALAGGERLVLGPDATLEVVHTPGHASNHLCFRLVEERLLFTGDHVMQGSTVVINPPDGDMAAYFAALRAVAALDIDWLAPGHGFLVPEPGRVIAALLAHRQRREDKVVAALEAGRAQSLADLVVRVYDDTPVALHAMARRSLLAHLLKLQQEGRAEAVDGPRAEAGTAGGAGGGAGEAGPEAQRWRATRLA
jgi:glyoxylase-like metal-dependent hydrolase (beta-lactamase superfamily II)/8-oxo-dGTP pyrophosphatase MutT (NUDIX family)